MYMYTYTEQKNKIIKDTLISIPQYHTEVSHKPPQDLAHKHLNIYCIPQLHLAEPCQVLLRKCTDDLMYKIQDEFRKSHARSY